MDRLKFLMFLPFARQAFSAVYTEGIALPDGSTVYNKKKIQNGYTVVPNLRIAPDGVAILSFDLSITARRDATVESLVRAAGLEIETKTFSSAAGPLVTKVDDVEADYNVLIGGQLFLYESVSTKPVKAGQLVLFRAVSNIKLVAK